ncbi:hypothetical protein MNBD_GAMMA08-1238 [hydrothermal vent metagenome]|uniref:Ferric oxidoreductase domain-containing protein n=1 Tax=hydrothermal vent metagenome TaxID=652676 RepID=A0A3B0XH10_9ZZZZ
MIFSVLKGGIIINAMLWSMLLLFPLIAWLSSEGDLMDYFIYDMPEGQLLYVISKLLGLYGLVFLWLHMSYALLRNSVLNGFIIPWTIRKHRNTALFSMALIVVHLLLFIAAVSLRKQTIAVELFIPSFSHGYYKSLLSFGVIAFWLILCVAIMGRLLSLMNQYHAMGIWVHRLSVICFILVYFHGLGVGSETKNGVLFGFYLFLGGSLLTFLLLRIPGFLGVSDSFNKLRRL